MDSIRFDFNLAVLFILAIFPILWGFKSLYDFRKERLKTFADKAVISTTVVERLDRVFYVKVGLFCIAWIFGVFALMQPKGNERYVSNGQSRPAIPSASVQDLRQKHHMVLFLVDVSASMSIKDNMGSGSRLSVAKKIVDDVISNLQGESVALFGFTSATMKIVPFTMDYMFTRLMLEQLQINEGETSGTDLKGALESILKTDFTLSKDSNKTLIILTDGGDTSLYNLNDARLFDAIDQIVRPLKSAEKIHLRTLVVGTGSLTSSAVPGISYEGKPVSSKLELPLLRRLSSVGDGQLWQTNETASIDIVNEIVSSIKKDTSYVEVQKPQESPELDEKNHVYDAYYQYPLAIAIIALAGCLLLPNTALKLKNISAGIQAVMTLLFLAGNFLYGSKGWSQNDSKNFSRNISRDLLVPATYFDSKNYEHAAKEYEGLNSELLTPWEQAILLYDTGTALLANKQYSAAFSKFQEAGMLNIKHPLLEKNLFANEALALLLNVKAKSAEIKKNENATFEDYSDTFSLYREAIAAIERAGSAACRFSLAEGQKKCTSSMTIDEMRVEAKLLYANFLESYLKFSLKNVSIQEGVTELIAGVKAIEKKLSGLNSISRGELFDKYLAFYKEYILSFLTVWDSLEESISNETKAPLLKEYGEFFKSAKFKYLDVLKQMDEKNIHESLTAAKLSRKALEDLFLADIKGEPYKVAVDRLLIGYKLLLIQDPLQESSLEAVREAQKILKESFSLEGSQKLYEKADLLLRSSQKALKEYKLITARFFAEGAYFYIFNIANLLAAKNGRSPPAILENSIRGEEISLLMTRLLLQIEDEKSSLTENKIIMADIQSKNLQEASDFIEMVIRQQKDAFSNQGRCQCQPWDVVIPLFYKGYDQANFHLDSLDDEHPSHLAINRWIGFQESSLKFWREALQKLKEKKQKKKNQNKISSSEDKKNDTSSQSSSKQSSSDDGGNEDSQKQALNEVLKNIQAMESDDKSAPSVMIFKGKEGDRPW